MASSEIEDFPSQTSTSVSETTGATLPIVYSTDLAIDEEWETVHPGIRNLENNEETVSLAKINETGLQPLSIWHEVMDVNMQLLLEKEALQAEKMKLEQEISIFKKEKCEIEEKQALEAENRRLQQEMTVLAQQKCRAEEKERQALQVNEALQEEVQELQALVQKQKQLSDKLEEAEAVHSFDELLVEDLKEQVSSLQEKIRELEQQVESKESSILGNENLGSEPNRLPWRIIAAKSRIQEKLTVPGGILKHEGKQKHDLRLIRILENKLNQDTMKFDELLCGNMDYREDIPHLLQQKGIACNIEKKFNRQLAEQQNMIEEMGERSTFALNQSLEAKAQMQEVKERMQVETAQFTKRRMQLKTVIAHEAKRHSFMGRKLQEIILLEDNEYSKKKKKQQQYEDGAKRLEMYMQGHSTLVGVTGERDVRQIGRIFIRTEQKNFAHINFINELHNRRNMLSNCTSKIKRDILILEQEKKWDDEKRKSQLKDLEAELEKYSCLVDFLENQCAVFQRSLEQLRTANNELLEAVSVTSDNMTDFTSVLEDSVSNLLIQANNVEDEQTEFPPQNLLLANSELLPECQVMVVEMERGRTPSRSLKSS
ncbi:coiled-coil domain-containing protein 63-like [Pempheris klunzingeri]|uniref:coiled-coil domain-containing protein 63-like n=1 Tax=Pempheris klunzingeri TaxID=3127111 RepID=UPI0039818B80